MNEDISQNPTPEPGNQPGGQGQQPTAPPPPPAGYVPYGPCPQPERRTGWRPAVLIPISLAIGCLPWMILFGCALAAIVAVGAGGASHGSHIGLIRVTGVISGGRGGGGPFSEGSAGSEEINRQLEKARKDKSCKAIVIRINSPGGSAAGSEEVWHEIQRVRRSGKPVYTSMGDVAASGGYYIASACDKIYSDASTITGSIGVIMSTADMSDLFKKIGYRPETIKSGKFKDIGSPSRALTPEERQLLQAAVNDIFAKFVQAVAEGRGMPVEQVKKIADGRIFTGDQAMALKLVDKIGGLRDTILAAAEVGGIKGEPKVVEYQRKNVFESVFGGDGESASDQIDRAVSKQIIRELLHSGDALEGAR